MMFNPQKSRIGTLFPLPQWLCGVLFLSSLATGSAQYANTTDPAGYVCVPLPADSDTFVNAPFKRPPEYSGSVASTDGLSTITALGTPGWTAGQFVYSAGVQSKRYYVFVASGTKIGCYYAIMANTATSVTLDLAGDTISTAVVGGSNATTFQIIPFDTLGTIFPAGQGIVGSTTHSIAVRQTEILIPDQQSAGTDLAAATSYYYYTGTTSPGPGWRKAGFAGTLADDDVLFPDNFFIVRMKPGTSSNLAFAGVVPMSTLQTPLVTVAPNVNQDNAVALPINSSLTLRQSNLFESGAFIGSPSHSLASRYDQLLVWDNSVLGHDKAATRTYYYYTGTSGTGPGWRLDGDVVTLRDTTDTVISASSALVVRKKASATPATTFWLVKPPYVP